MGSVLESWNYFNFNFSFFDPNVFLENSFAPYFLRYIYIFESIVRDQIQSFFL